ncbi:MAG: DUF4328 domain-containing protein [Henriciella sp.]
MAEFVDNDRLSAASKPSQMLSQRPSSPHGYADGPRSAIGLNRAMRLALIAYIVAEVLLVVVIAPYLLFPQSLPSYMFAIDPGDINYLLIADYTYVAVSIVAFFFSCRFIYRAMRNLHTIQSPVAEISPTWSVGYYFIPFVNLVMPANAMSQIYHGTHEAVGEKSRHASPIGYWWAAWLVSSVPDSIASNAGLNGIVTFALYGVSAGLGIIGALILIRMGSRIADRQEMLKHGGIATVFD